MSRECGGARVGRCLGGGLRGGSGGGLLGSGDRFCVVDHDDCCLARLARLGKG
jgi:hypothetical protein